MESRIRNRLYARIRNPANQYQTRMPKDNAELKQVLEKIKKEKERLEKAEKEQKKREEQYLKSLPQNKSGARPHGR